MKTISLVFESLKTTLSSASTTPLTFTQSRSSCTISALVLPFFSSVQSSAYVVSAQCFRHCLSVPRLSIIAGPTRDWRPASGVRFFCEYTRIWPRKLGDEMLGQLCKVSFALCFCPIEALGRDESRIVNDMLDTLGRCRVYIQLVRGRPALVRLSSLLN